MIVESKKGLRCNICTGCGRCPGVTRKVSVVTDSKLAYEAEPIINDKGIRLVVADIGTTTIAMRLLDRNGEEEDVFVSENPQTQYGADVLSRIRAAEENHARLKMQKMVQEVLCRGLKRFAGRILPEESLFLVIAGNTTMVYLFMGYNPAELGQAPFHAGHLETIHTKLWLDGTVDVMQKISVPCVILPGFSAFVGGDIYAGMHACGMQEAEEVTLLVDLGTNGEMLLGNKERIIGCATAAGPAFEGGVNKGIWGSDMVGLLAELKRTGWMDETGLLAEEYFEKGVRIGNVCVTQESIRAIQLAKGAIRAGIEILAKQYNITPEEIDRVVLAGGFGYYLNPEAAGEIGLLPKELVGKTVAGGNTALLGAAKLGSKMLCKEEWDVVQKELPEEWKKEGRLAILNLAQVDGFEENYMRYMNF